MRQPTTLIVGCLLALTIVHLLIVISSVGFYNLNNPFMDEFRLNHRYLTVDFPKNIFTLDNGHRPILPGLARYLELTYLEGHKWIQFPTAWLSAAIVLAYTIWSAFRANNFFVAVATACVCVSLLLWNANARMFIHTHEAVHLWYVMLAQVICLEFLWRAHRDKTWYYLVGAVPACLIATISFGSGIATFAPLVVLAILMGFSWRVVLFLIAAAATTFVFYFLLLPGADGVRGSSRDLALGPVIFFAAARMGALIHEALASTPASDHVRASVAAIVGGSMCLGVVAGMIRQWLEHVRPGKLGFIGIGFFVLGLVANLLIATNRVGYFFEYPDQVFADRYLFWSCLLWAGALLWALEISAIRWSARQWLAGGIVVLSILMLPGAYTWHIWSAEVFHVVERAALGLQLGLRDDVMLEGISDGGVEVSYRSAEAMRRHGVVMFADADNVKMRSVISFRPAGPLVPARREGQLGAAHAGASRLSGTLSPVPAGMSRKTSIWIAANNGTVVGRATLDRASSGHGLTRLILPVFDGFDGYMVEAASDAWLVVFRDGVWVAIGQLKWID